MASQFSIKLSVSATDLIKSIKQTIDDINTGDKLKNKPLNISVSAAKLRESIRAAIDEINASDKLKSKPINITASESYLRKSLRNAIDNINASGALTNKPIKLSAKLDTKSLAQQLQALESIPNTSVKNVVETIIKDVEKAQNEVNDFTTTLEKLYEVLDDVISKQEKLADAFKQIQLGSALSAQEILELIKAMPDLAQYVKKTAEGYTITAEGIRADQQHLKLRVGKQNAQKYVRI